MPILLYCIAESSPSLPAVLAGVGGLPVARIERSDLAAFISQSSTRDAWDRLPLRQSASEFYRVLQQLFEPGAILPFRFPTVLDTDTEVSNHLEMNVKLYGDLLNKFRGSAQMEALISYSAPDPHGLSGTGYLRARKQHGDELKQVAASLKSLTMPHISDWRCRSAQNILRCFALVDRSSVPEFKRQVQSIALPSRVGVRITGPWPVTEFLNLNHV